jgi:hypothetical protein
MINLLFSDCRYVQRVRRSLLGAHVDALATLLLEQGYSKILYVFLSLLGANKHLFTSDLLPCARSCRALQDPLGSHVFHQLCLVHEISRRRFALAEEFFRLIVPVAAPLVIALAKRDDRIRLGWFC